MTWKLKRLNQCKCCPWKKSTDPFDIPDGYDVKRHKALACTIAEPGAYRPAGMQNIMSCHEHPTEDEAHCVGWLANQLGPGNNIGLRIAAMTCENMRLMKLDGPQHDRFEDTLPKRKRRRKA